MENIEKTKAKNFIRYYNNKEIEKMNFLFEKNNSNNWFTHEELVFVSTLDLFDNEKVENAKIDWFNANFE